MALITDKSGATPQVISSDTTVRYGGTERNFNLTVNSSMALGIDISRYNTVSNWQAVKNSGIDFAFVRVGGRYGASGVIYDDGKFEQHINGALGADIDVGVYFFTQAITEEEAVEEARYTCEKIKNYNVTYPVVIDTEALEGGRHNNITKEQRTKIVRAFCNEVKKHGYTPMIYANLSWLNNRLTMSKLSDIDVWVAHYSNTCGYNGNYKCWQYTDSGYVQGISGSVDMNKWYNW